jgi:hypothetical protein
MTAISKRTKVFSLNIIVSLKQYPNTMVSTIYHCNRWDSAFWILDLEKSLKFEDLASTYFTSNCQIARLMCGAEELCIRTLTTLS